MEVLAPVFAAVFIYVAAFLIGVVCNKLVDKVPSGFLQSLLQDFVKTTTICIFPFGHAILWRFFGGFGFLFGLVPLMVVFSRTFPKGEANPVNVWMKCIKGVIPPWQCLLKTLVQTFSGLVAYEIAMILYSTEMHVHFSEKILANSAGRCNATLHVPMLQVRKLRSSYLTIFVIIPDKTNFAQTY